MRLKIFFYAVFAFFFFAAMLADSSFALTLTRNGDGEVSYLNHPDKSVSPFAGAIDDRGLIYIAWAREDGDVYNVYVVVSRDKGASFSDPMRVNLDFDAPSGMHAAPSLAVGPNGAVYVAWASRRAGVENAADIRLARSMDGGRDGAGFETSVVVNDAGAVGNRGFESMAVGPDGEVYVVWLDARENKKGVSTTYSAKSVDGGRIFSRNVRIDGNSCPCCRTAVAVSPAGAVYVSWRKVMDNGGREIVAARSVDKGEKGEKEGSFSTPVSVGRDDWKIDGCPHRGPGLAASKDAVYEVWYTEAGDGVPCVNYGSVDASQWGKDFNIRTLSCGGKTFPDHPALTLDRDGRPVFFWEETTPVLSRVMTKTGSEKSAQLSRGARRASYPSASVNKKGAMFIVWSQDEMRYTKTAFMLKD